MTQHCYRVLLFCLLCTSNVYGESTTPWDAFAGFCDEKRISVLAIQFSPCKRWMAATGGWKSGTEGVIIIWDIAEQKCSAFYREFPRNCGSADFTPDGKLLAVTCGDKNVYLFELARKSIRGPEFWRPLTKLQVGLMDRMNLPEPLAFSPDGEYLCVSVCVEPPTAGTRRHDPRYNAPKKILVWRTGQWGMLPERIGDSLRAVNSLKFYENRKIVAGVGAAQKFSVHLYDIASGERLTDRALASLPDALTLVCPVPQTDLIAVGSAFDQIHLVDHVRQEILVKLPFERGDNTSQGINCHAIDVSADGRYLAACSVAYTCVWDLKTQKQIHTIFAMPFRTVNFTPDSRYLLAVTHRAKQRIIIWNCPVAD